MSTFVLCSETQAQRFRVDDPIWVDPDRSPVAQPAVVDEFSQAADFLLNTFTHRPGDKVARAANINTAGLVPDSSWFTNRMSARSLSLEELVRGPNRKSGPDQSQPWVIVRAKTQGITPGFSIRDSHGDTYFIKFDPASNPEMATSAEVICTKFFHAFGYNVPENHLAFVEQSKLAIDPEARITDENGKKRRMTEDDLDRIFDRVAKAPDGSVRAVASLMIEGKPIGPFRYYGTRSDDANDLFPHEDRRELRALRVFAAWLNHDDSRSINTGDFFVPEGVGGYVRHYLIDFGSCLGSGSVRIQGRRAGNEYMLEWTPMLKSALTLGLWDRPWRYIDYPDYPSIGRFEADYFQPRRWKPEYPNPAFDRMQPEDAFWATRIVKRFTDEMIRAIVRTGRYTDPKVEAYLVECLIKRRDKIVAEYLRELNPLDDFEVAEAQGRPVVRFTHLGEAAGLGKVERYEWQWFSYNNHPERESEIGRKESGGRPEIQVPAAQSDYLLVKVRGLSKAQPNWQREVRVYLRREGASAKVVGVEWE